MTQKKQHSTAPHDAPKMERQHLQHIRVVILIAPVWGGKDTTAESVCSKMQLFELGTGAQVRLRRRMDPAFYQQTEAFWNAKGKDALLPDSMIIPWAFHLLKEKLQEGKSVLLNGLPRSQDQLVELHPFLRGLGINPNQVCVVHMDVDDEVLQHRAFKLRRPGRDEEQSMDSAGFLKYFNGRMRYYREETAPLVPMMRSAGYGFRVSTVHVVSTHTSTSDVTTQVMEHISRYDSPKSPVRFVPQQDQRTDWRATRHPVLGVGAVAAACA